MGHAVGAGQFVYAQIHRIERYVNWSPWQTTQARRRPQAASWQFIRCWCALRTGLTSSHADDARQRLAHLQRVPVARLHGFPRDLTLGGWLGGALQWHFAAMWLLVLNGLVYVGYGIVSRHFKSNFLPLTPRAICRRSSATHRTAGSHELGVYNAVQRAAYFGVLAVLAALVLSGLAVWKPVQLQEPAALLGGYEGARLVHFNAMLAGGLVRRCTFRWPHWCCSTLLPMLTGRAFDVGHTTGREMSG